MYRTIIGVLLLGICGFLPTVSFADAVIDTGVAGGGSYHANIQPGLGLYHIIALEGFYPSQGVMGSETVIGEVSMFAGNFAPRGWAFTDGQLLPISQNQALFSILGTTYGGDGRTTFALPDLRGRTAVGPRTGQGLTNRNLGQKFGDENVTLTEAQMPNHNHTLPAASGYVAETSNTGGSQQHTNMQPSLALNHTIALQGVFPSQSKGIADPYIGEVGLFAGNFAPRDWAFTDGQMLSISGNEALFSILGTTYGGDGRTTFGLPDLRGRTAVGPRTGPGLSTRQLGQKIGAENVTLSWAEMPSHNHTLPAISDVVTGNSGFGRDHDNMQPSLALNYIIALQGAYPSRNIAAIDPIEGEFIEAMSYDPFVGEVSLFAGNFAPRDWAFCDGQILNISQNEALFSLMGTTYGGDGRTTFGLPDLRGRVAVHPGTGPGLRNWRWGEKVGGEDISLTLNQLPSHGHRAIVTEVTATWVGGGSNRWDYDKNWSTNPLVSPPQWPNNGNGYSGYTVDYNVIVNGGNIAYDGGLEAIVIEDFSLIDSDLTVQLTGLTANGTTIIDGSSLSALYATLSLPHAGSYTHRSKSNTWQAEAGEIDLSGVETVQGPTEQYNLNIKATDTGEVNLRSVTTINGSVQVWADGQGSAVNLSSLESFQGYSTGQSYLKVSNQGTIMLGPATLTMGNVGVTVDATSTINGGGLRVEGGGPVIVTGNLNMTDTAHLPGAFNLGNGTLIVTSPSTLSVDGNLEMDGGSQFTVWLGGQPGAAVTVTGDANVDGTLSVELLYGFEPQEGQVFGLFDGVLSGTFDTVSLPALTGRKAWDASDLYTTGRISVIGMMPGDTDVDWDVDTDDYNAFVGAFGGQGDWRTDFNEDGRIDLTDFVLLRANFDLDPATAPMDDTMIATPEPATMGLLALGGLVVLKNRRRRK